MRLADLYADALCTIGEPHDTARGALRLLRQEGFHLSRLIDLSDGGPIMMANLDDLYCLQMAHPVDLCLADLPASASPGLVSSGAFEGFCAYTGPMRAEGDKVILHHSVRERLQAFGGSGFLASLPASERASLADDSIEPQQPTT